MGNTLLLSFSSLDTYINGTKERLLLAMMDNEPIAQIIWGQQSINTSYILEIPFHTAYIRALYVNPDYRRQGIALSLLNSCCEEAKEQGYTFIGLTIDFNNVEIETLYEKAGFSPVYEFEDKSILFLKHLNK